MSDEKEILRVELSDIQNVSITYYFKQGDV